MNPIDIVAIVLFMAIVFITGMAFSKSSGKNMSSFFAADGAVPWWMNGLSLFMSFFSAGTFVVWGAIAYSDGLVSVSIQWTMCIAGVIIGIWIAPRWQKTRVLTVAEYITRRLGLHIQKTYTILFLGVSIFTAGGFLYPVAKIVEVWSGIPAAYIIIVIGALMAIYTAVGGLWAVVVTGVLQFIALQRSCMTWRMTPTSCITWQTAQSMHQNWSSTGLT